METGTRVQQGTGNRPCGRCSVGSPDRGPLELSRCAETRSQGAGGEREGPGPGTELLVLATHFSVSAAGGLPLVLCEAVSPPESGVVPAPHAARVTAGGRGDAERKGFRGRWPGRAAVPGRALPPPRRPAAVPLPPPLREPGADGPALPPLCLRLRCPSHALRPDPAAPRPRADTTPRPLRARLVAPSRHGGWLPAASGRPTLPVWPPFIEDAPRGHPTLTPNRCFSPTVWRWVGWRQAASVAERFRGGVRTLAITPAPPIKSWVPGGLAHGPCHAVQLCPLGTLSVRPHGHREQPCPAPAAPSRCQETQKLKCFPPPPASSLERERGKVNISVLLLRAKNYVL